MKRITLVMPSMTSGGAERVMATLANAWVARGDAVTLLSFDDGSEPSFYPLHDRIDHQPLAIAGASHTKIAAIRNTGRRLRTLRREIGKSRPDVVLSFLDTTNVTTLLATRGLGIPVVVEEHTDPGQKQLGLTWKRLRDLLYPRASRVVVLSEDSRGYFNQNVQSKTQIIPNPIVVEVSDHEIARQQTLIGLGRLGPEKGFDLLIDAFSRIAADYPDWRLEIWGEGKLRADLEAQVKQLGVQTQVTLPGRTQQPHEKLRAASIFVMSSRREGFPMALGEAMACGLAVVSTDCPSGPRQLIRDEVDGLLVATEDARALAVGMRRLMNDHELRQSLASRAPEVLDRFGLERVLAIWDDLFDQVIPITSRRQSHQFRTNGLPGIGTSEGSGD